MRSLINPSYFRKINWLLASNGVKCLLRILFLSTGMELYPDIFMKYEMFKLHSADIARDHRWHWTVLIPSKKAYPS